MLRGTAPHKTLVLPWGAYRSILGPARPACQEGSINNGTRKIIMEPRTMRGSAAASVLLVALCAAGCSSATTSSAPPARVTSSAAASPLATSFTDAKGLACAQADPKGFCPGDDPAPATRATPVAPASTSAPAAPAAPAITGSQEQALSSAQGYLSDGQGFSRQGLIDQLHSPNGEGFPLADATWAVDHSGANWYQQAVLSAKGYMNDGQGFSRSGLIEQLTSPYGEQFTYAQATYAVKKVGL